MVVANYKRPFGPVQTKQEGLRHYLNQLTGSASGDVESPSVFVLQNDGVALDAASYSGQAIGVLIGASLEGELTATIGATAVAVATGASDLATMTALAAAIRANTTVNQFATASNLQAYMTLATVLAGTTVKVCGITFTAVATAGDVVTAEQFSISGNDTADALALANAINRHPALAGRIRALSIAGVVRCVLLDSARSGVEAIGDASASTITINQATFVASTYCYVIAAVPGVIGNFVTVTVSGTGLTYATNGTAGQLGSGTGAYRPLFAQVFIP